MQPIDAGLQTLVDAIITDDLVQCSRLLRERPELATASFHEGASRQTANKYFLTRIKRYIWAGDTALHLAAAAYETKIAQVLIEAGALINAKNRHGAEPLHAAAVGQPGTPDWNLLEQSKMLELLIDAGSDPNTTDKRGVTPLHIAVRTRSAAAVETLLRRGADPTRTNKSGSTALKLAKLSTGKSGSGSEEARAQQQQILRLLEA
ncbi:MAG TPA: ankyrin repeat domain-containing protein [Terracidiphilus sp.]|nr:ankyrin repeat domain-containing protein [Terracidiphilus sp.]